MPPTVSGRSPVRLLTLRTLDILRRNRLTLAIRWFAAGGTGDVLMLFRPTRSPSPGPPSS